MYFWGAPTDWLEEAQTARLRYLYAFLLLVVKLSGLFTLNGALVWASFAATLAQIALNALFLPRRAAWLPNLNFLVHRALLVLLLAASGGVNGPFVVVAYMFVVSSLVWYNSPRAAAANLAGYLFCAWLGSFLAGRVGFAVTADHLLMHTLGLSIIAWLMATPISRLNARASTDDLTSVLNRRSGMEALSAWVNARKDFVLIFTDLEGFKKINDTHGHVTGDAVLAWVARMLRNHVRADDLVIRYGGDEFLIAMHGQPGALLERLERVFDAGVEVNGVRLAVRANLGVARFPEEADGLEELLHLADQRMYDHKHGPASPVSAA